MSVQRLTTMSVSSLLAKSKWQWLLCNFTDYFFIKSFGSSCVRVYKSRNHTGYKLVHLVRSATFVKDFIGHCTVFSFLKITPVIHTALAGEHFPRIPPTIHLGYFKRASPRILSRIFKGNSSKNFLFLFERNFWGIHE